jgi:hypothetical protein
VRRLFGSMVRKEETRAAVTVRSSNNGLSWLGGWWCLWWCGSVGLWEMEANDESVSFDNQ